VAAEPIASETRIKKKIIFRAENVKLQVTWSAYKESRAEYCPICGY
jgi:hypothetical protein